MADVEQRQSDDNPEFVALMARVDAAVAFADWANQAPPSSEPGTAAMTFNQMLNDLVGKLAKIAACYELKQASEQFQDSGVMSGMDDPGALEKAEAGQQSIKNAQEILGCSKL